MAFLTSKDYPLPPLWTIVINGQKIEEPAKTVECNPGKFIAEDENNLKPSDILFGRRQERRKITKYPTFEIEEKPEIKITFLKDVRTFDFPGRYITSLVDANTVKLEGYLRKYDEDSRTISFNCNPQRESDEIPMPSKVVWRKALNSALAKAQITMNILEAGGDPSFVLENEYDDGEWFPEDYE